MRLLSTPQFFFPAVLGCLITPCRADVQTYQTLTPADVIRTPTATAKIDVPSVHNSVEQHVAEFLYQQAANAGNADVQVTVQPLDPLLKMTDCSDTLQINLRQTIMHHRHSVQVKCPAPAWSLYVSATLSVFQNVVISQHALARKQIVDANDLTVAVQDITLLDGDFLSSPQEISGLVLRRPVAAGAPLTQSMFEQAQIIKKGDSVTIVAKNDAIQVSSQGQAMENGKTGEQISVKNQQSGRVIKAVAIATGHVEIAL